MEQSKNFIITINHMLGSGGAYIGKELSEKLNILYLDREIVSKAAEMCSTSEEEIQLYDEKVDSLWDKFIQSTVYANPITYVEPRPFFPTDKVVHDVEVKIMKKVANEKSVVILGRVGTYIFNNHPRHISVFLHGNIEFRKDRVQKLYNINEKEALKKIEINDKERKAYYRNFTGNELYDSRQYTICLDTSKFDLDECVEIILKYVQQKIIAQE